jgi:asparagine N-glycosylation enzyme membrane subunit Stt3
MKVLIVLAVIVTLGLVALHFRKHRDVKKTAGMLALFALLVALAIAGGVTRAIPPLFLAHIIAVIVAWAALMWYILGGRFFWYAYALPVATVLFFWVLEYTEGSRHEALRSGMRNIFLG